MTAQPTASWDHHRWTPDDARQRLANYTVEDVLALPDDAPRVELDNGVLVVVPSPAFEHQDISHRLWRWFDDNAPVHLRVAGAVGVAINNKNTLEPDIVLLRSPVGTKRHYFAPDQVALVVEIVSPGTKKRDRFVKPKAYAGAGIPHYWRIDQDPVHVYAYELGDGEEYRLVADSASELVLTRPFEIRLQIEAIRP